jgi:hypothetical protein
VYLSGTRRQPLLAHHRIEEMDEARSSIAARMRWQAEWCGRLGSPLYVELLERAALDVERGGTTWELLREPARETEGELLRGAVALRLLGAVHRLVLEGRAPELARFYPSAGGSPGKGAADAFLATLDDQRDAVQELFRDPVQTNEVGRSAALLGGFLVVAGETGLPLRLLEVGASAGLNLRWDRYWYSGTDGAEWGDPAARVRMPGAFPGRLPPFDVEPTIAERRGCDPAPLDPGSRDDRLTLLSYVWPDQRQRLELLRAALETAPATPVSIDTADAVEWLEQQLRAPRPGEATVVFHSVVLPYLDEDEIAAVWRTLDTAGAQATADAPLAWLSMEAGPDQADVRLMTWPGAQARLLAHATFHGLPVEWVAD